ncbi:MAG: MaoC family dehydratase [Chloroflexota bacterium]|nr:MaoC family dehydratase [Chloroflexota bacterium]
MSGKYYDELTPGMVIPHALGKTITEADNSLFCALTMNQQPLHIDAHFAARTEYGQRLVNGLLTMSLVVGISVADTTQGTIVANLGYESVRHPAPVFHGDTIYAETTVVAARESKSRPDAGIITLTHLGRNQHGVIVVEVTRSALFLKRPVG